MGWGEGRGSGVGRGEGVWGGTRGGGVGWAKGGGKGGEKYEARVTKCFRRGEDCRLIFLFFLSFHFLFSFIYEFCLLVEKRKREGKRAKERRE